MKASDRMRIKAATRLRKKPPTPLLEVPKSEWPSDGPKWMTRAYRNNRYTVIIQDFAPTNNGVAIRAMVQAHDNLPIRNHWSQLQKIKNKIFGEEATAIEYYPPESKLIDEHQIYWLWVFPIGIIPIPFV